MNFDPEIVIVGPDPETGILTQNFILTYAISSATELQLNKSLGQAVIRDAFETVQVGWYSYSHTLIQIIKVVTINYGTHLRLYTENLSIFIADIQLNNTV